MRKTNATNTVNNQKKRINNSKNILSFYDDNSDTEDFFKKTKKKVKTPLLHPVLDDAITTNTQRPKSGDYSAEKLQELRNKQRFQLSSKSIVDEALPIVVEEVKKNEIMAEEFIPLDQMKGSMQINRVKTTTILEEEIQRQAEREVSVEETKDFYFGKNISTKVNNEVGSFEAIEKSIECGIQRLENAQYLHQENTNRLEKDLLQMEDQLKKYQNELDEASKNFSFFQRIRDYVTDLCSCLREKIPMIDQFQKTSFSLEACCLMEHQKKYKLKLIDELKEIESRKSLISCSIILEDNKEFIQQVDRSTVNGLKKKEKTNETRNYRQYLESDISSDDEQKKKTKHDLMEAFELIFDDVDIEFSSLNNVCSYFKKWKLEFPTIYQEVYCSLSIVQIFEVFIRMELLQSNYLKDYSQLSSPFARFSWFQILYDYSDELDDHILPDIINNVFLPQLKTKLEYCFQPFSRTQNQQIVLILNETEHIFQQNSTFEFFQQIFSIIISSFQKQIDQEDIPLVQVSDFEALKLVYNQFWRLIKLQKNIALWENLLPLNILNQLIIQEIFLKKQQNILQHVLHSYNEFSSLQENIEEWISITEAILESIPLKIIDKLTFSFRDYILGIEKTVNSLNNSQITEKIASIKQTLGISQNK